MDGGKEKAVLGSPPQWPQLFPPVDVDKLGAGGLQLPHLTLELWLQTAGPCVQAPIPFCFGMQEQQPAEELSPLAACLLEQFANGVSAPWLQA